MLSCYTEQELFWKCFGKCWMPTFKKHTNKKLKIAKLIYIWFDYVQVQYCYAGCRYAEDEYAAVIKGKTTITRQAPGVKSLQDGLGPVSNPYKTGPRCQTHTRQAPGVKPIQDRPPVSNPYKTCPRCQTHTRQAPGVKSLQDGPGVKPIQDRPPVSNAYKAVGLGGSAGSPVLPNSKLRIGTTVPLFYRVPASVGSRTETRFPKPALRAGSGKILGSGDRLGSNWNNRLSELQL